MMILNPSRTHTTFGNNTQFSEQPSETAQHQVTRNTMIKEEMNKIHLDTIKD